jgi:membrane-bound serine protease (ClpP class)
LESWCKMDIANTLWQLLINPNIAYLLLIIGIWSAITAFIMPGTGLAEAIAAVSLVLGIVGLAQLPVDTVGAVLIVLAFVLFILELKIVTHGALTVGGVVSFAAGSIFLVKPNEQQAGIAPVVVGITTLVTLGFFVLAVSAAVRTHKLPIFSNPQTRLIGARGIVKQSLAPVGTVQVKSELWTAVADEPLAVGEHVTIVKIEGLRLRVARAK